MSRCRVEWLTELDAIGRVEQPWRELEERARSRGVHALWDFVYPYFRHLTGHGSRPLAGMVWADDVLVGVAPMVAWRGTLGGVPVRRVDPVGHQWGCGELLMSGDHPEVAGWALRSLAERGGFDVATLSALDASSRDWEWLQPAARVAHLAMVRRDYAVAVVDLSRGFDGYCAAMGKNFRHNLKRMTARINGAGGFRIDRLSTRSGEAEVKAFLDRVLAITDLSWKAREGGPLPPEHRRFTRDVLGQFAARGGADLAILQIGGRDAAFIAALRDRATYYDFTIAFDDEWREYSPGTFLMIETLRLLAVEGIGRVVSHGAHEYKRRWATHFETSSRAYFFSRGIPGRLAKAAKFDVPAWWTGPGRMDGEARLRSGMAQARPGGRR